MSPDKPPKNRATDRWHYLTPWRIAVLGAYFCLLIYGIRDEIQTNRVESIAGTGRAALCAQVNFLENNEIVTKEFIAANPGHPDNDIRRDSLHRVHELVIFMRRTIRNCPSVISTPTPTPERR